MSDLLDNKLISNVNKLNIAGSSPANTHSTPSSAAPKPCPEHSEAEQHRPDHNSSYSLLRYHSAEHPSHTSQGSADTPLAQTLDSAHTSAEPARLMLEKESSITSDYSLFSESYSKCNFADFSKPNLVLLLSFFNTISRETLPVKCILLTLKTLLKCVKCELVELCQIDDSNLTINYMFKEGMLHKKEVKYHRRGLYNLVLSTGSMLLVGDVRSDDRYSECDQHTEVALRSLLLIPLFNLQQSIWGVVSLANFKTGSEPAPPDKSGSADSLGVNGAPAHHTTSNGVPDTYAAELLSSVSGNIVDRSGGLHSVDRASSLDSVAETPTLCVGTLSSPCSGFSSSPNGAVPVIASFSPHSAPIDEQKLRLVSYLCFMSGIIISNAVEKVELEINKLKSNSLITLMHSLFSDQLGIQSCVIALTTHAKKLIQAESCAVYLVDQARNQLWSISSNTGEQSVYPLDSNNILSLCVALSKIIVYDSELVDDSAFNKSNIMVVSASADASADESDLDASSRSSNAYQSSLKLSDRSEKPSLLGRLDSVGSRELDREVLERLKLLRNGIWVPIKHDNRVLAVIEVINKQAQELLHFTEDDLNLLELFAVIVGPQFEKSEFASVGFVKKTTEAGLAFENVDKYLNNNVKNFIEQSIIEEEDVIME